MRFARLLVPALLAISSGTAARAETLTYSVDMRGQSEVPPNASQGIGKADVAYDTTSRSLSWVVTYAGLSGPATGMHFHGSVEPGKNAGILLPMRGSLDSPVKGSIVLTDAQAADLTSGKWYINIHTNQYPGGELRGQVVR